MDGRPGPGLAGVAKREDSYGPKSGPKAGARASSPGEQAAACDYQKTRELGRGASRSLRLQKNSCAGPNARIPTRLLMKNTHTYNLSLLVTDFQLISDFKPTGDQPLAIERWSGG